MKFVDWIIARLGENSTWRGLIAVVTAAGITLKPEQSAAITAAGLALIGLINVFRSSTPPPTTPPTP